MALRRDVASSQPRIGDGLLMVLGPDVDAVRLLVEEAEEAIGFDVGLGPDAELGQEDDADRYRRFCDDFRRRGVEPPVGPAFENSAIRLTKGASTCPP